MREALGQEVDQALATSSANRSPPAASARCIGPPCTTTPRGGEGAAAWHRAAGQEDGRLLRKIASLASATALAPATTLKAWQDQVLQAIGRELDFRVEAGNTRKLQGILGRRFVPHGSLKVPTWCWRSPASGCWCSSGSMAQHPGEEALQHYAARLQRGRATKALLGAFVEQYFVEGFFHADPHPGNLKVDDDGVITLLDEGMVGMFDPRSRTTLLDLVLA